MANQTKENIDVKEALLAYFKSVKLEWGKITWPPRQQILVETVYVVIITAIFTIAVLAMDTIISAIFKALGLAN